MSDIDIGQPIADFSAVATGGKMITLAGLRGKNVVLYFYPRANTPGCTRESEAFRDHHAAFEALDAVILGASRDGLQAQENFRAKYQFPFDLISDKDEALCRQFDVIKLKKMYGRESLGIERSTFLIDKQGVLRRQWRKVKVPGHVEEVLQALQEIT
jgi:peroxiredoxin Q/BCP